MQTEKSSVFKDLCESHDLDHNEIPEIMSFEDACKAKEIDPLKLPEVSMLPERHQKSIIAHYKLIIIAEALNEGWTPDWSNRGEYKYYPWLEVKADKKNPSGLGFSCCAYGDWTSDTYVGSRLCFRTSTLALYAGRQFSDLYKDLFLLG